MSYHSSSHNINLPVEVITITDNNTLPGLNAVLHVCNPSRFALLSAPLSHHTSVSGHFSRRLLHRCGNHCKSEAIQQTLVETRRISSSPLQRHNVYIQVPSINSHRCHVGSQPSSNRSHCHSKFSINLLLFGFEWRPFRKLVVMEVHTATVQRTHYSILVSSLRWPWPKHIDRLGAEMQLYSQPGHNLVIHEENGGLLFTQGEPL